MVRRRKIKHKLKRLNGNKTRRALHIYKLKRRIAERRQIGFVILGQQC